MIIVFVEKSIIKHLWLYQKNMPLEIAVSLGLHSLNMRKISIIFRKCSTDEKYITNPNSEQQSAVRFECGTTNWLLVGKGIL